MKRKDAELVEDILSNIKTIEKTIDGLDFETFIADEFRLSTARLSLIIIGEAAKFISLDIKSNFSDIPWNKIVGFRNRIIHEYHKLDYKEFWRILSIEISILKSCCLDIKDYLTNTNSHTLLDGKKLSEEILNEIAEEVKQLKADGKKTPHLAAILVGNDGASETYVASKVRNCERVGFDSTLIRLEATISEIELLAKIKELNHDKSIDGFIVQLPLPKHIDDKKVTEAIAPEKDVDGFHPMNIGKMVLGLPTYLPATPNGVMEMLKRYKIDTEGKNCVVLGRSNIVGSPMANLMFRNTNPGNATVTICHSKTKDLKFITQEADILIVAIGKPEFVTAEMVKPGAVVVDVGIHRLPDATKKSGFKLVGDVKFDEVAPKTSFITPVPGGVGLMTICSLLQNTLLASKNKK